VAITEFTAEPGIPQIIVARRFEAPRELVFRAHTDPGLLARWIGPEWLTTTVECLEPRDGGRWRLTQHDRDGNTYCFHGLYHGTPSPERIVQTWECTNMPGPVYLNTITFEDLGAATFLRQNTVFQSVEDRDDYVKAGAETGARQSTERLAALLATLAATS
jgi:uncharacterized protein YndB with AHSA1/START domain